MSCAGQPSDRGGPYLPDRDAVDAPVSRSESLAGRFTREITPCVRSRIASTLGILALAVTASAAPAKKEAWASGQVGSVDTSARSVVVKQGKHEMTFALAPDATLTQGATTIQLADLAVRRGQAGQGPLHDAAAPPSRRSRRGRPIDGGGQGAGQEGLTSRPLRPAPMGVGAALGHGRGPGHARDRAWAA